MNCGKGSHVYNSQFFRLEDEKSSLEKERDDALAEVGKSRPRLRLESQSRNWRVQWVVTGSSLKPHTAAAPSYVSREECEAADHENTAWMLSAVAVAFDGKARFTASCVEVAP